MEGHQKDGFAFVFWFVVTVVLVSRYTTFGSTSVSVAALLWLIAWLTIRVVGDAITRLETKAWQVVAQLGGLFGVWLWLGPPALGVRILVVWGIGLPLVLIGTGARYLHDCVTARHTPVGTYLLKISGAFFVAIPAVVWWDGSDIFEGVIVAAAFSVGLVPFFFGWQLGERARPDDRDARFADQDDFRRSGVSHDL